MAREKRKFEIQDKMAETYTGSGGKQSLSLPAGLELYKPKKSGAFRIEIIPFKLTSAVTRFAPGLRFAPAGTWHWTVIYRMHGGVGPDNASVVCSHQTFNKPCPICEQKAVLGRSSHPDDKKAASAMYPRERMLMLVSERDERAGTLGPVQLWEISTFCFKKQLDLFLQNADLEDRDPYAKFWYPEEGLTLKVVGSEESMGEGNYSKYSVMELKARREPLPDDIFDHGYDLYAIPRERSYADIKAIFSGVEDEAPPEDEDVGLGTKGSIDEEDFPAPSKAAKKPVAPPPAKTKTKAPEPAAAPVSDKWTVGQAVQYTNAHGLQKGEVIAVDEERQICQVKVAGRERPMILDFDELTPLATTPPHAGVNGNGAMVPKRPVAAPPADDDDDIPPPPKSRRTVA